MNTQNSESRLKAVLGRGPGRALGRRTFLKSIGATALTASAGAATMGAAYPRAEDSMGADVLVIGAGFAGVTAAREIRARGLRPLIIEARARSGGRAWTDTFQGQPIDMGAGWFHPNQSRVMAELQRLSISTVVDDHMDSVLMASGGAYQAYDPTEAFTRQGALFTRYFDGVSTFLPQPLNPLASPDLVGAQDQFSIADRFNQVSFTADEKDWISGTLAGYGGAPSTLGGWTSAAQWWALGGGTSDGWYALTSLRPVTGTGGLLQSILADSGVTVRYNAPVATVSDNGSSVTVTTKSGGVYRARAAVVAVPTNVWKTIRFTAGLPKAHTDATAEGLGVPHATKIWMYVRGPKTRTLVQSAEGSNFESIVPMQPLSDGQLMIGFGGENLVLTLAGLNAEVKRILGASYEVVGFKAAEWHKDPYSLGGWSFRKPTQLLRQLPALQQQVGRLSFANDGLASGWNGFIEGAMEAGLRAADQAADLILPSS